jgi:hypothetical protein
MSNDGAAGVVDPASFPAPPLTPPLEEPLLLALAAPPLPPPDVPPPDDVSPPPLPPLPLPVEPLVSPLDEVDPDGVLPLVEPPVLVLPPDAVGDERRTGNVPVSAALHATRTTALDTPTRARRGERREREGMAPPSARRWPRSEGTRRTIADMEPGRTAMRGSHALLRS